MLHPSLQNEALLPSLHSTGETVKNFVKVAAVSAVVIGGLYVLFHGCTLPVV